MKTACKSLVVLFLVALSVLFLSTSPAWAAGEEETAQSVATAEASNSKAWAAALVVGLASAAGAVSMGWAISKSVDGIARQPEAEDKIRTSLMLGLVFVETAVIYALIVAILIIFVL